MIASVRSIEPQVMLELNTTPLIDVLLVLLVMLIITIPISNHAVKMDLPGPAPEIPINTASNVLSIDHTGALAWNGKAIAQADLRGMLERTASMPQTPELHLQPAPDAPYGAVDGVLATTKRAHVDHVGFVGNEAYSKF